MRLFYLALKYMIVVAYQVPTLTYEKETVLHKFLTIDMTKLSIVPINYKISSGASYFHLYIGVESNFLYYFSAFEISFSYYER